MLLRTPVRFALALAALAAVLSVATSCRSASSTTDSNRPSDADVHDRLARATETGRELHRRDMIAWWATDVAVPQMSPQDRAHLRGWLLDADDSNTVHFLVEIDGELSTRMLVRCDGSGPQGCAAESLATPRPISERNRAQYHALRSASEHPEFVPTSERYNHVVMPAADSRWWVYLIAATVDPDLLMFGRHYRFLLSPDGSKVVEWRAFTKSALVIERQQLPPGAEPVAVAVSHQLDDIPTEMHVWAALNYRTPVAVMTGRDVMWMIDETGVISPVE